MDAEEARLGGYSGPGNNKVSILDGIRRRAGSTAVVRYEPGPGRAIREFDVVPAAQLFVPARPAQRVRGLTGEYFDNPRLEGAPRLTRTDARMDFRWTLNSPGRGIPFDWYSVRWTGIDRRAGFRRRRRIGVEGNDGYRLYLDDALVIDNWQKRSYGTRTVADVALAPRFDTSHQARVFRNDRQRASEADLECRRRRLIARRDRRRGGGRSSKRRRGDRRAASRKASSAIARSSACRGDSRN